MYFQIKNTLNYNHSFKIKKNIPKACNNNVCRDRDILSSKSGPFWWMIVV